ncbi:hypothetical protein NMG60_11034447 [Bertholletia excelsa]
MANAAYTNLLLLLFTMSWVACVIQGSRTQLAALAPNPQTDQKVRLSLRQFQVQQGKSEQARRSVIGSTTPTCTYNECKGCKYKCSAMQVPVEGNDPMNSPYHYKCVCHL